MTSLRCLALLSVLACGLCGCEAAVAPLAVASLVSIATIKRDPADVVVSLVTGLDCSIVRMARGKNYCQAMAPPPSPPRYCTHSLAGIDCWDSPNPFGYPQREVADGPDTLTEQQEANRTARWPFHEAGH
jgi:hypothetical protein